LATVGSMLAQQLPQPSPTHKLRVMARYYYSGGQRRELTLADERLAIDTAAAEVAGLGRELKIVPPVSRLPGGMAMYDRSALRTDVLERLQAAGAVSQVYRSGTSFVVLMPEVRVELDAGQDSAAREAVLASTVASDVTDSTPERISLRPQSGSAEDALDLANFIYERARPAASSVRMLHVVPKSDVHRETV
jgi:hypothetical protein